MEIRPYRQSGLNRLLLCALCLLLTPTSQALTLSDADQKSFNEILTLQAELARIVDYTSNAEFRAKQKLANRELKRLRRLYRKTNSPQLKPLLMMRITVLLREAGRTPSYGEVEWQQSTLRNPTAPSYKEFLALNNKLRTNPASRHDGASKLYQLPSPDIAIGAAAGGASATPRSAAASKSAQAKVAERSAQTTPSSPDDYTLQEIPLPVQVYRKKFSYYAIIRNTGATPQPLNQCDDKIAVFMSVVDSRFKYDGMGGIWTLQTNWKNIAARIAQNVRNACNKLEKIVFVATETKQDRPLFRLEFNRSEGFQHQQDVNVMVSHQIQRRTLPYVLSIYEQYRKQYSRDETSDEQFFAQPPATDVFLGPQKFIRLTQVPTQPLTPGEVEAAGNRLLQGIDAFEQAAERADFAHRRATGRGLNYLPLPLAEASYVQETLYPAFHAMLAAYTQWLAELPYSPEYLLGLLPTSMTAPTGDPLVHSLSQKVRGLMMGNSRWRDILQRCQYERFSSPTLCLDPYRNFISGQPSRRFNGIWPFVLEYVRRHDRAIAADLKAGELDRRALNHLHSGMLYEMINAPAVAQALMPKLYQQLVSATIAGTENTVDAAHVKRGIEGDADAIIEIYDSLYAHSDTDNSSLYTAKLTWLNAAERVGYADALHLKSLQNRRSPVAFDYAILAARAGHVEAMKSVAKAYQDGEQIEQNNAKAQLWYFTTVRAGDCSVYPALSGLISTAEAPAELKADLDDLCSEYLAAQREAQRQARLAQQEAARREQARLAAIEREKAARRAQIISDSVEGKTGSIYPHQTRLSMLAKSKAFWCHQEARVEHQSIALLCWLPVQIADFALGSGRGCENAVRSANEQLLQCIRDGSEEILEASLYVTAHRSSCAPYNKTINDVVTKWGSLVFDVVSFSTDDEDTSEVRDAKHEGLQQALSYAFERISPSICR